MHRVWCRLFRSFSPKLRPQLICWQNSFRGFSNSAPLSLTKRHTTIELGKQQGHLSKDQPSFSSSFFEVIDAVKQLLISSQPQRALAIIDQYRSKSPFPERTTFSIAKSLLVSEHPMFAVRLLESLPPSLENFNKVLELYVSTEYSYGAAKILQDMDNAKIAPSERSYELLLRLLQSEPSLGERAREVAKRALRDFPESQSVLVAALCCMAAQRFTDEVASLRQRAADRGLSLDTRTLNELIAFYARQHDVQAALELTELLVRSKQLIYTAPSVQLLHVLGLHNKHEEAIQLFRYFTETLEVQPSHWFCANLIRVLAAAHRFNDAKQLLRNMAPNLPLNAKLIASVILLRAEEKRVDKVIELLPKLQAAPQGKDPAISLNDLRVMIRACNHEEEKLRALSSACIRYLDLHTAHCEMFLEEFKEAKQPDAAFFFFDEICKAGRVRVTHQCLETLMSMSTADPKRTLSIYSLIKKPTRRHLTPAILEYVQRACELLDDDGYSPEEITVMMGGRETGERRRSVRFQSNRQHKEASPDPGRLSVAQQKPLIKDE